MTHHKVKDSKFAKWSTEDAQIHIQLRNSIEPQISGSLVFLEIPNKWGQAQQLYSGVNNLHRTYDLRQTYFSFTLGDSFLEDYYGQFCGICKKLNIC